MGANRFSVAGVVLAVAGAGCTARAQPAGALRLDRKIEMPDVSGRIDHMSVDVGTGRLFMAALGNNTVEVVDVQAARRLRTISGLAQPQGVLFVASVNRLFVANGADGTVRIFDGSSLAPLKRVALGADADNLRLDAANGRIWVGYGEGALAAIDAAGARLTEIPLGAHPESFQLEKAGPRAFVNLPDARKVAVVDRERRAVVARWSTGDATANFPMALDEANRRLFVVCRSPARLLVLNTDSGAIVTALATVGDADDVFYDAGARRIYVSGGAGAIAVCRQADADHYEEETRIQTVRGARTSFFSPDLGRLFLAVRRQEGTPAGIWIYDVPR